MKNNIYIGILSITLAACQTLPLATPKKSTEPSLTASGGLDHVEIIRLLPTEDVRIFLERWAIKNSVKAASILSAVGSLKTAVLRFADQHNAKTLTGPFEIVSLTGTVAASGVHLHLSVSDKTGQTVGGHLTEGSLVYTTLELVIGVYRGMEFVRRPDERTGFSELYIF